MSEAPERRNLSWDQYVEAGYERADSGALAAAYLDAVAPVIGTSPRRVLDVGTGPGHYLAGMHAAVPGAELHGFDVDEGFLDRARKELDARGVVATLHTGAGLPLPFDSGAFDLVLVHLTLPYVPDERAFLNECTRVLRPGGALWLSTHGIGFFLVRMVRGPIYLRFRWLASILAGLTSMAIGWKPVKDTPVTTRWLRRALGRSGLDVRSLTATRYAGFAWIISGVAVKRRA